MTSSHLDHPLPIPAWLTAVLRQAGALQYGAVQAVESHANAAFNSQLRHLQLQYTPDAAPALPTQLVLKQNLAEDWAIAAGADEVTFYQLVARMPDHPPITIPCLAASADPQTGHSYLLLEDISATHAPPMTRAQQLDTTTSVPAQHQIDACIDTLAQLHAFWWDHPLREENIFAVGYWSRTAERFAQYLQRRRRAWEQLQNQAHSWFPADLHALYEETLDRLPDYWERQLRPRFAALHNLTLIHGDAYFANFLCPRAASARHTYLVDWQSPSFDIGAYDLVNLCATFWTAEQRHAGQREMHALQRYHAVLLQRGVAHYRWENLVEDYQHGLIFWLLMPLQDAADGADTDYWWPKMQCVAAAFQEWQCDALLGRGRERHREPPAAAPTA